MAGHVSLPQVLAVLSVLDGKSHVGKDAVEELAVLGGVVRGGLYLFKAPL